MKTKEGKAMKRENALSFCEAVITIEISMRKILEKWNKFDPDTSYEEELEETPWLLPSTIFFNDIEEDFMKMYNKINDFKDNYNFMGSDKATSWCWQSALYFDSHYVELLTMIQEGGGCEDNSILNAHRIAFDKTHRYILASIYDIFEIEDIISNSDKVDDIISSAASSCGVDADDYCKAIYSMKNSMPISVNPIVNNNQELIENMIISNGADRDMFLAYSEAVMPYDLIAVRNNELLLDDNYIKRLAERIEDDYSLYNQVPQLVDIFKDISSEYAYKFYKFEPYIKSPNIDDIKNGKYTVNQLLDSFEKDNEETLALLRNSASSLTNLF